MSYLDTKGRIFDIQRYSIHDGPGIRTIVFVKGCIFRCKWCCNPESQRYEIETMRTDGKDKVIGEDITAKEVLDIVEKDRPYYYRSGGGLTMSGGEILLQPDFVSSVLRGAKERGINTAVESMAGTSYENIEKILPYLDYYLMDIKHMNSEKHKEFIGAGNERVLENAMRVAKSGQTELIIRVPVVPSFNCTTEEIKEIALFAQRLPNVTKIHLLPYHRMGTDKYEGLKRVYQLTDIVPPSAEEMKRLKSVVEQTTSLKCMIGG